MSAPVEIIESFCPAVLTALQELAHVEAQVEVEDPAGASPIESPLVIATIQLLRDPPALLTLALAETTAANLASSYLPPGKAITADIVNDVIGEFANVIAGQAKTCLKGTPYHYHLAIPAVARSELGLIEGSEKATLRARFRYESGEILLLVAFPPVE